MTQDDIVNPASASAAQTRSLMLHALERAR